MDLKGKFYELLNADNSVMTRFKINHVRTVTSQLIEHPDGSISAPKETTFVSENGNVWFQIYGGSTDRISGIGWHAA